MFLQKDKRWEYLKKSRERQIKKFFSPENIKKRKEKQLEYNKKNNEKKYKLKKFSDKMIKIHEEDVKFYQKIWISRPHYCENCGKYLGNNFKDKNNKIIVYRYAHIIPKSIYPYLRHFEDNIMLLCLDCHTKFDNSNKEILKEMKCFDEEKIEMLKKYHKQLEQEQNNIYK